VIHACGCSAFGLRPPAITRSPPAPACEWPQRRRERDLVGGPRLEEKFLGADVGEVEEFEETIDDVHALGVVDDERVVRGTDDIVRSGDLVNL
jgi:hypothetical protein